MRGHSLPEALVCAMLFTVIVTMGYSSLSLVTRARQGNEARLEPRMAARSLLDFVTANARSACYVFTDRNLQFAGYSYNLLPTTAQTGQEILLALPAPPAPTGELQFRVIGIHMRPRAPLDSLNPGAHQVVARVSNPVLASVPAMINLNDAGQGAGLRVFDTYTPAEGLRVVLGANGDTLTATIRTRRQVPHGPVVGETLQTTAQVRNL